MEKIIQFQCKDGIIVQVPDDDIFQRAKRLRNHLTLQGRKRRGMLSIVFDSMVLVRVVEFLTKHKDEVFANEEDRKTGGSEIAAFQLSDWDRRYFSYHVDVVPELTGAGIYFEIYILIEATRLWIQERNNLALATAAGDGNDDQDSYEPVRLDGVVIFEPYGECKNVAEASVAPPEKVVKYRMGMSTGVVHLKQDEAVEQLKELQVDYELLKSMYDDCLKENKKLKRENRGASDDQNAL